MSRVGIGNNVTQPDARCMSCKRWKSASKRGFFDFVESGHCSLPYCERDARNKGKRGNINGRYCEILQGIQQRYDLS